LCILEFILTDGLYVAYTEYSLQAGRFGDRIPVGEKFSMPVHTGPEVFIQPPLGTGSLPRLERPGRGADHPPHLAPSLRIICGYVSASRLSSVPAQACHGVTFTFTDNRHC